MRRLGIAALVAASAICVPSAAHAFCGFYVNGAGGEMFNNATQVVLMRQGTRTVLSMQNNYQGPPSDFAMVVPVPVVLHEEDVKTLTKDVFAKVDRWARRGSSSTGSRTRAASATPRTRWPTAMQPSAGDGDGRREVREGLRRQDRGEVHGRRVRHRDPVGDRVDRARHAGCATSTTRSPRARSRCCGRTSRPASKFFVAKVDPKKVTFENGQAMLSPLRFHYDSDEFSLPIRLGLANSSGTQDLIVNILSPEQRYEVANYKNVTIPTNLDVKDEVAQAVRRVLRGAVRSHASSRTPARSSPSTRGTPARCDPCPGPTLDGNDFATLGADVLGSSQNGSAMAASC